MLVLLACSSAAILTEPSPTKAQPLALHAPIYITSKLGVENFTSVGGVLGTGTAIDPYIIQGWEIVTSSSVAIHIQNTHSFFIIRKVALHGPGVTGQSEGIYLDNVQNGEIQSASITNFYYGLQIAGGSANKITTSNLSNNTMGLYMTGGTQNSISANQLNNNTLYGAWISSSTRNSFTGNNASLNGLGVCPYQNGVGFLITGGFNNTFANNLAIENLCYGFNTTFATDNVYRNNSVSKNQFGIIFTQTSRNLIIANNATGLLPPSIITYGVGLEFGNSYNSVTQNRFTNIDYGVYVTNSSRNTIYNNIFLNAQVSDDWNFSKGPSLQNYWNITKTPGRNIARGPFLGGNFYSSYSGSDSDGDGIGDTPYAISGGVSGHPTLDLLPIVPMLDVSVRKVSLQQASEEIGVDLAITISTFNEGILSSPSFLVSVYANQTSLTSTPVTIPALPGRTGNSFVLNWNTTGLRTGYYILVANASLVPGENDTANNISPLTTFNLLAMQPPVAAFTMSITSPVVGQSVSLNASASNDPDGTISSYSWDLGDGTTGTGATITHNYTMSNQPSVPSSLQATAATHRIVLNWTAPSYAGGYAIALYLIFRKDSPSGAYANIANVTGTSYVDDTVSTGQTYEYYVKAVNSANIVSDPTASYTVQVPNDGSGNNSLAVWLGVAGLVIAAGLVTVVTLRRRRKPASLRKRVSKRRWT